MIDRRASVRNRTFWMGSIVFNQRCSTMNCRIVNRGESGARLELDGLAIFPEEIDLMATRLGDSRLTRVVWRDKNKVGVEFVTSPPAPYVSVEEAQRLRVLERLRVALASRDLELI